MSSTQEAGTPPPRPLQVPEIIKHVYHHMHSTTDAAAQETIRKVLHVLAQTYTDEVVLTLFEMDEQSQRWVGPPGGRTSPQALPICLFLKYVQFLVQVSSLLGAR